MLKDSILFLKIMIKTVLVKVDKELYALRKEYANKYKTPMTKIDKLIVDVVRRKQ